MVEPNPRGSLSSSWKIFRFEKIHDGGRRHLGKKFKWPYLRNRSSDPLHVWFLGGVFGDGGSNGTISADHIYGQFTCLRRQHHITSLLMRKTLELDFVREGSLGYTVSRKEMKLQLLTGTITNSE